MKKIELRTKKELESKFCEYLKQRQMPDYVLYLGDSGVKNWLDLDSSAEFTVASSLTELLRSSLPAITRHLPGRPELVSIGVGSGEKEKILLQNLAEHGVSAYCAVDISSEMVDRALAAVAALNIGKTGLVAFLEDLARIKQFWTPPVLLCLLGNNFSNYDPDYLLETVHAQLQHDDLFLFDCQLLPAQQENQGRKQIEQMYHSQLNVRFNLDPLVRRGMNPDDCIFHLELLPVQTGAGTVQRTRKWLEILKDTTLECGQNSIFWKAGDTITMGGFTYKYTRPQVQNYLRQHSFQEMELFLSPDERNLLALVRKSQAG